MHIIFLNPQGNFDPKDSHLTEHPDFGGQLVYVKEVACALATAGHKVDIVTRRIIDPDWPEFADPTAYYSGFEDNPTILRIPCGGDRFLAKEQLWPHLDQFVTNILAHYGEALPDFATAHYADGGYCAVALQQRAGLDFTFTGHSLGAQKLDKLGTNLGNLADIEARFRFSRRIAAERLSIARAARIVTSTTQESNEQYAHPLYADMVEGPARFLVNPPGVNAKIFTTETGPDDESVATALDAQLGTATDPFILVSSRLDEKKNIIGVASAYAGSDTLRGRARLAVCIRGIDDPYAEMDRLPADEQAVLKPILSLIDDGGFRDRVVFLNIGSQSALAATYRYFARRKSVFALTALYEPFGLAPIEAAACGLACVVTRNGGPSEIFSDGSGVLVDPLSADDIAQGLATALDRHGDLQARGFARVQSTYSWDRTAGGYLDAIAEAAARALDRDPPPPLDAGDRIRDYLAGETAAGSSGSHGMKLGR